MAELERLSLPRAADPLQALFEAHLRSLESRWLGAMIEPLTEREREVLLELADGESNATIARRLHISRNTVASHLRNIYQKIGTSNRLHAALAGRVLKVTGSTEPGVTLS